MIWKPHVTVAAIACVDDRYLLVEEDADNEIVFNQPAGHLEKNETLTAAVIREVLEETAWDFEPDSVTGIYLYPNPGLDITYLRVCFSGRCLRHHPGRGLDKGIIRAVWMSRQEVADNQDRMRSPLVLRCIDDHIAGRTYPLDFLNYIS